MIKSALLIVVFFFSISVSAIADAEYIVEGKVIRVRKCHATIKQGKGFTINMLRKYLPSNIKRGRRVSVSLESAREFFDARTGGEMFARKLAKPKGGTGISARPKGGTGISARPKGGTGISKDCEINGKSYISNYFFFGESIHLAN